MALRRNLWSRDENATFLSCLREGNPKKKMFWVSRPGVSGDSRSRPFPSMKASDSLSQIMGMDFFIPFPFPNFGNVFFHSLPVPEFWEWIFSFPSRSQTLGMEIFHSLPVPELTISKSGIKRENDRLWEMLVLLFMSWTAWVCLTITLYVKFTKLQFVSKNGF